jgi:hypothetical protein
VINLLFNPINQRRSIYLLLVLLASISCSKKTTTEIWKDNKGQDIPVKVTEKGDTKIYDFGTIILDQDTTRSDTIPKK